MKAKDFRRILTDVLHSINDVDGETEVYWGLGDFNSLESIKFNWIGPVEDDDDPNILIITGE